MRKTLFTNAVIHTGRTESEVFSSMLTENGVIKELYPTEKAPVPGKNTKVIDLKGQHVYPCLIDAHVHMLLTVAVMAMGFNICEITAEGVQPHTLKGVEERLKSYVSGQKEDAVIACNNYILTAIDERRMPTKEELDDWCGGRAAVIYNIDGHSTSLSTKMLELVGINPDGHSGVLQGEENERTQGRIINKVGSMITLPTLAKGIARFQNACASYGI
ncbi:MAG: amidohydrolase family protein, partial [Acutalibacteraceae bacterium]